MFFMYTKYIYIHTSMFYMQDLLVWRGSQTGGNFTADNWQSFPRSRLVLLCKHRPTLCDAAWSEWTQVDAGAKAAMGQATGGLGTYISLQEQQQYRCAEPFPFF